jgi:hypothetical protein
MKVSIAHKIRTGTSSIQTRTRGMQSGTSVKLRALAALAILALLCASSAFAKKEHQWQTGMLLGIYESNVDAKSLKTPQNPEPYAPKDLVNDTFTIDAGEFTYQSAEMRRTKGQPPPFTVNTSIQFAIEGQHVYLKDDQGKEHDTKLVVRRRKTPAANSQ